MNRVDSKSALKPRAKRSRSNRRPSSFIAKSSLNRSVVSQLMMGSMGLAEMSSKPIIDPTKVKENSLQSIKYNLGMASRESTIEMALGPDILNMRNHKKEQQGREDEEIDELQDSLEELCQRMGDSFESNVGIQVEDSPLQQSRQPHLHELLEKAKNSQSLGNNSDAVLLPSLQSPCHSRIIVSQGSRNGSPLFLMGMDHATLTKHISGCSTISVDENAIESSCEGLIANDSFPLSTRLDEVVASYEAEPASSNIIEKDVVKQRSSPVFQPDLLDENHAVEPDTISVTADLQLPSQSDPSSGHSLQESLFQPGQKRKQVHQEGQDEVAPQTSKDADATKKKAKFFSTAIDQNLPCDSLSNSLFSAPLQLLQKHTPTHLLNVKDIIKRHHDALSLEISDYLSREVTALMHLDSSISKRQQELVIDPEHHWDGIPSSPDSFFLDEGRNDFQLPASFF